MSEQLQGEPKNLRLKNRIICKQYIETLRARKFMRSAFLVHRNLLEKILCCIKTFRTEKYIQCHDSTSLELFHEIQLRRASSGKT